MFINKFVQKCQYYYTLLNQSVSLVTVTSIVFLLTIQLSPQLDTCFKEYLDNFNVKLITCLKFKKRSYFLIGQLCTLMVVVVILSEGFLFTVHTYYYNGITTQESYHTHGITPVVFIRQ